MKPPLSEQHVACIGSVQRGTWFRITLFLGAHTLLCAAPAAANTGIEPMAAFFPLAWLLLLVIIPLEAWVAITRRHRSPTPFPLPHGSPVTKFTG
jgi:hypothetical protein